MLVVFDRNVIRAHSQLLFHSDAHLNGANDGFFAAFSFVCANDPTPEANFSKMFFFISVAQTHLPTRKAYNRLSAHHNQRVTLFQVFEKDCSRAGPKIPEPITSHQFSRL